MLRAIGRQIKHALSAIIFLEVLFVVLVLVCLSPAVTMLSQINNGRVKSGRSLQATFTPTVATIQLAQDQPPQDQQIVQFQPTATRKSQTNESHTPIPTLAATVVATQKPSVIAHVDANIRSGPSLNNPVIGVAKRGFNLSVITANDDRTWLKVCCINERDGWIYSELVYDELVHNELVHNELAQAEQDLGETESRRGEAANYEPNKLLNIPPETPIPVTPSLFVAQNQATIRLGPSTTHDLIGNAQTSQTFMAVGRNANSSWWVVCCVNGKHGWINSEMGYLTTLPTTVAHAQTAQTRPTAINNSPTPLPITQPITQPKESNPIPHSVPVPMSQEVQSNIFAYQILGWTYEDQQSRNGSTHKRFVKIDLSVRNISDRTHYINNKQLALADASGTLLQPVFSSSHQEQSIIRGDLPPRQILRGALYFNAPVNSAGMRLVVLNRSPSTGSGEPEYLPIVDPNDAPEEIGGLVLLYDAFAAGINTLNFLDSLGGPPPPLREIASIALGDNPQSTQLPAGYSCLDLPHTVRTGGTLAFRAFQCKSSENCHQLQKGLASQMGISLGCMR